MPKTRREEGGLGDWSSTGTFLRKPTSGWLHEDRELSEQSSINYQIWYLGCIEVRQSMRTLQYTMRTQVTKEAIVRMAEVGGKLSQHKKRKVPKQLNRLLGAVDTRWTGEVNLAVSAENLKISNTASSREIMNHSLPSISFASGGDGPTIDFIGYVAKDPVHERACHVFECVECSQYVLTTIGQAFELRYKMYLNSPQPEPMQIRNSVSTGDSWALSSAAQHTYEGGVRGEGGGKGGAAPLPSIPGDFSPSPYSPTPGAGIYSDLPEFPSENAPSSSPSPPSVTSPNLPPVSLVSDSRPRVYSKLPGFPTEEGVPSGTPRPRLENPYDTMQGDRSRLEFTDTGVYSEPGEITSSASLEDRVYDNRMLTIKQSSTGATPTNPDLIDLTPPLQQPNHIYSNSGMPLPQDSASNASAHSRPKPSPAPKPQPRKQRVPPSPPAEATYDVPDLSPVGGRGTNISQVGECGRPSRHNDPNDYDDPDALELPARRLPSTPNDTYDDILDVIEATQAKKPSLPPPPVVPREGKGTRRGGKGKMELPPPAPVYEDPNDIRVPHINGTSRGVVPVNLYDTPADPQQPSGSHTRTPRFDDTIYAVRRDMGLEGEEETDGAVGDMDSLKQTLPDPLAPLPQQQYFHGVISRVEAEGLLDGEGEFLVRESTKMPGQFVLTGLSPDGPQHLLLMDKSGKVKSRDHHFDSIPHLVDYFTSREIPLVIGRSQVYLKQAIINAFPSPGAG